MTSPASELGKRSVKARKKRLGKRGFNASMKRAADARWAKVDKKAIPNRSAS